jgi:hypothetical protein
MSDSSPSPDKQSAEPPPPSVEAAKPPKIRTLSFEVRASWLLLGAVLVGFGPLAALAIVASIKDADALSTVALALAIVAFAIQVLVFIVQTQATSQQMLQSERLNTQTRELLAEVNTAVVSTQTMVGEQFRDLLRAFVEGASQTAAETGKFDPEQFEQRLMTNIQQATQRPPQVEQRPVETPKLPVRRARRQSAADKKRELAQLTEFPPEEEGKEIAAQLRELSPDALRRLQELGEDEISSREGGVYVGLADTLPADEDLDQLGLLKRARVSVEDGVAEVKRLTDKGRLWASLLVATGDMPDYAEGLTPPLSEDE